MLDVIQQVDALSGPEFIRYSRQIFLPEVGETGQLMLKRSHVVIVGCGGLGQLAAHYLASAGIGQMTLVDGDRVELSNLPRQILYSAADIGQPKAIVAKQKLTGLAPSCELVAFTEMFNLDSATKLFSQAIKAYPSGQVIVVLDCTDNLAARQCLNQFCITHTLPLVSASISAFSGQLLAVDQQRLPSGGCYHCIFPSETIAPQNCNSQGVLGPSVGVMASMQALVAIQLIVSLNNSQGESSWSRSESTQPLDVVNNLLGRFWRFDGKTLQWRSALLTRNPDCAVCGTA
ncbi:HesA/MoeB/ThiF family protein [Shewanella sp. A25]|nr:HesA/MoeB/ThiF family protein [Shewanella shenzhenensis]